MIGKTKAIDDKIRQSFIHHLKNRSQKLTPSSSLKYAFDFLWIIHLQKLIYVLLVLKEIN